jgi:predicted HicB family RNase H-like nuclease
LSREKSPTQEHATKRQFLVHLDAQLIRRIKIRAINQNVSASSLVEDALRAFLDAAARARPPAQGSEDAQ